MNHAERPRRGRKRKAEMPPPPPPPPPPSSPPPSPSLLPLPSPPPSLVYTDKLLRGSYGDIGLLEPPPGRPLSSTAAAAAADSNEPLQFGRRDPSRCYTRNQRLDEQRKAYKRVSDSVDALRRMLDRQQADKENAVSVADPVSSLLARQQCDLLQKRADLVWQRVERSRELLRAVAERRDTLEREMPELIVAELVAARAKLDALRHLHEHFFDRPTELRAQARRIVQDEQRAVRQIRAECTTANRRFTKTVTRLLRLELELLELLEELFISRVQEGQTNPTTTTTTTTTTTVATTIATAAVEKEERKKSLPRC